VPALDIYPADYRMSHEVTWRLVPQLCREVPQ
jgi:hypothetical protein